MIRKHFESGKDIEWFKVYLKIALQKLQRPTTFDEMISMAFVKKYGEFILKDGVRTKPKRKTKGEDPFAIPD
jgi:hypothetical protein